jgi:DNA polymerase-3 subunit alpha
MGDNVAQSIIDEREKNGPYKSVFDFAQRVNYGSVNRKAFESLALSGGFDSFGIPRENYFGVDSRGNMFLDVLIRYGQLYQAEKQQAQTSLFGDEDAVDIATPPVPQGEPWSTIERLNRERDLVGIYLSAHPLDEFSIVLKGMCNTHCSELEDKNALLKKEEVTFGGIITAVKDRYTKTGKPMGVVTIEDFEGSGELALFGEEWGKWRGMFVEGCTIFVRCKFSQRFATSNYIDMKVLEVQYLQTVRDNYIERFTITINSEAVNDSFVNDLSTLVAERPGKTELYLQIVDRAHNTNLLLRSSSKTISLDRALLQYIESNEDMSYQVN